MEKKLCKNCGITAEPVARGSMTVVYVLVALCVFSFTVSFYFNSWLWILLDVLAFVFFVAAVAYLLWSVAVAVCRRCGNSSLVPPDPPIVRS
ncbi:MAG: hypothetical protein DMF62_12210 [Acidobacteria bacterium]|nr:MAG: hypothetical protein DMF62_12210 [Acidobacteriota bacterium]